MKVTCANIRARYAHGHRDFTDLEIEDRLLSSQPSESFEGALLDGADFSRSKIAASFAAPA